MGRGGERGAEGREGRRVAGERLAALLPLGAGMADQL